MQASTHFVIPQDNNVNDIRGIPESAPHRKVDLECVPPLVFSYALTSVAGFLKRIPQAMSLHTS
jgi:hypothetical protein